MDNEPFRATAGRNRFVRGDPSLLADHEFAFVQKSMSKALGALAEDRSIDLRSWTRTHALFFGGLYPWAGRLRDFDAEWGSVRFSHYWRIEQDAEAIFEAARNAGLLRSCLGYIYGGLAAIHPFFDGNRRSLNAVFNDLCRREGFGLAWERMDRSEYSRHVIAAVAWRDYSRLQGFLAAHVVSITGD